MGESGTPAFIGQREHCTPHTAPHIPHAQHVHTCYNTPKPPCTTHLQTHTLIPPNLYIPTHTLLSRTPPQTHTLTPQHPHIPHTHVHTPTLLNAIHTCSHTLTSPHNTHVCTCASGPGGSQGNTVNMRHFLNQNASKQKTAFFLRKGWNTW